MQTGLATLLASVGAVFVDPAFVIIIIGREREQIRIFCDEERTEEEEVQELGILVVGWWSVCIYRVTKK